MSAPRLHWLKLEQDWRPKLHDLSAPEAGWPTAIALARTQLDLTRTRALDQAVQALADRIGPPDSATTPIRLALLGSSTLSHLAASIRVAALRRGLFVSIYEADYGQYLQELLDHGSGLHRFQPTAILFAFDPWHVSAAIHTAMGAEEAEAALAEAAERIHHCWDLARNAFAGPILQQTLLPALPSLLGENEQRLPGSRGGFVTKLNAILRRDADAEGVDLIAIDHWAARHGIDSWHDPALWHRAKQEITPAAAPFYGDLVARVLAARRGRSAKCLVLDLDNTLWGGVVGDDGIDGLVLGQGSALGEGFAAVQAYARDLARRGIILAVCSKNDETVALNAFKTHPEMVLKPDEIACFVANWDDKANNIKMIAERLNIGLDALVFLDDNPFERNLVRTALPMVGVPEVPEDPALVPQVLADAGYFEGVALTDDDRARTAQYQANQARSVARSTTTDLPAYLRSLAMELLWRRFDRVGLQRTVQLINKTNQFNLTTRRYSEAEVEAVMTDPRAVGLQVRLLDRFGDNGIIAIVIGRLQDDGALLLDTWLMSCRVLGRGVEQATLNLLAAEAIRLGATRMIGVYKPTDRNAMVRDHYPSLGFEIIEETPDGDRIAALDLAGFTPSETFMTIKEG